MSLSDQKLNAVLDDFVEDGLCPGSSAVCLQSACATNEFTVAVQMRTYHHRSEPVSSMMCPPAHYASDLFSDSIMLFGV